MEIIKLNIGIAVTLVLAMLAGCSQYLDVKSDMKLETIASIESLELLMDASQIMNFNVNSFGEASADDYWLDAKTYASMNENARNIYTWNHFNYLFNNDWAKGYLPIYYANLVIDRCKEQAVNLTQNARWRTVYGTALFFRGFQHMGQVFTYAKAFDTHAENELGVVLRTSSDPSIKSERANNQVTYEQILDDFKLSLQYLPIKAVHPMRPSKWASYAAIARLYLAMNDYENAYKYADSCIAIDQSLLNFNDPGSLNVNLAFPIPRFNKETIFYAQLTTSQSNLNPNNALIDTLLYQQYAQNDLRKVYYFKNNTNGYVSFKGNFSGAIDLFAGITVAEVYLIKAESEIKLDKMEEGIKTLNDFAANRYRNFSMFSYASKSDALSLVRQERRKELLMRGLRWIDVKRLNVAGEQIGMERKVNSEKFLISPNSSRFALPLPADIVNGTSIKQNEYND